MRRRRRYVIRVFSLIIQCLLRHRFVVCVRYFLCHYLLIVIRVHRQALFAQSATLCFQYLGFHDHAFNRAKLANYVICPGLHGFRRGFQ